MCSSQPAFHATPEQLAQLQAALASMTETAAAGDPGDPGSCYYQMLYCGI